MTWTKVKVTFLGGGPGGFGGAADALQTGLFDVTVYAPENHKAKMEQVWRKGHLQANGSITGRFAPTLSTNLAAAVSSASIIVNMMPAEAHEALFDQLETMALTDVIYIAVASVFSAPIVKQRMPGLKVLESPTLPYVARWGHGEVNIYDVKRRYLIGSADFLTNYEKELVSCLFSSPLAWQSDSLLANLKAVNLVIHTAGAIVGFDEITSKKGQCYFYGDILARPDVADCIRAMSDEVVAVMRAYGYGPADIEDTLEVLNNNYGTKFRDVEEFAKGSVPHNAEFMCPTTLPHHRYLTQDAKHGLVFLHDLARRAKVDVPAIEKMIERAGDLLGENLFQTGRTLSNVHLEYASPSEILSVFGTAPVGSKPMALHL